MLPAIFASVHRGIVYICFSFFLLSKLEMCCSSLCLFQKFPIVDFNQRLITNSVCRLKCHTTDKAHIVYGCILVECDNIACVFLRWICSIGKCKSFVFCILQKSLANILVCQIYIDSAGVG